MTRKSAIQLSIACAGLVIAGLLAVRSRPESQAVTLEAQPVDLICAKCGGHSTMSYEDYSKAMVTESAESKGPVAGAGRTMGTPSRWAKITCPLCHEKSAQLAGKCPKHASYFPKYTPTGGNGKCPKCAVGN